MAYTESKARDFIATVELDFGLETESRHSVEHGGFAVLTIHTLC